MRPTSRAKSAPSPSFTADELLTALAAAPVTQDGGGLSIEQIARQTGHSTRWVQARLRALFEEDRLEHIPVYRPCMNGRIVPHSTYRLKGAA